MTNRNGVDFSEIVKNADKQGIDLSEVALIYEELSLQELAELKRHDLITHETAQCVLGKFNKEGIPLFPDKVKGVFSLSA